MICDWRQVCDILPPALRELLKKEESGAVQEIRLRLGQPVELNKGKSLSNLNYTVAREDISYVVNVASRYSPWQAQTISQGYLSIPGGHRIGLCGQVICSAGNVTGIRDPESLCIRVARDVRGIGTPFRELKESTLIIGAPGWGKTTLLRDISREIAYRRTTVVLDERGELFPKGFERGRRMDVLSNCPKAAGIDMAIRTMGPEVIALDEITLEADCRSMIHASHCGVMLLATAHAVSIQELNQREIYRQMLDHHIFSNILVLHKDKSSRLERMYACN